jgi:proteasome lid subunit RPN8/RPN11
VLRDVLAHAREAAPEECCGLLVGRGDAVVEAVRARNVAEGPNRFLIDAQDHILARRRARDRGLEIVGFYHSHPHSAAEPSATDREEAGYPDHLFLIVGLREEAADIRLFRLTGGNFLEVPFVRVR